MSWKNPGPGQSAGNWLLEFVISLLVLTWIAEAIVETLIPKLPAMMLGAFLMLVGLLILRRLWRGF